MRIADLPPAGHVVLWFNGAVLILSVPHMDGVNNLYWYHVLDWHGNVKIAWHTDMDFLSVKK